MGRQKTVNNKLAVLRIRIRSDPHLKSPPGSVWTDADPDSGGKKA